MVFRIYLCNKYNELQDFKTSPVLVFIIMLPSIAVFIAGTIPSQFSYSILDELSVMHSLINYLLPSKFIEAFPTYMGIISKDDILILALSIKGYFSSSCFVFIMFRWRIINSLASCNNFDHILLILFVTLN